VNPVKSPPRPRNATERSILDAARELIAESGYERTTIDGIARRAIVSRTAVYFYFPNKRAIIDRLIQRSFSDMYAAASPYLDGGGGDPRQDLRDGIAGVAKIVNRDGPVLLLAARQAGERSHLPDEWMPHLLRLVRAAEKRIERDQQAGLAFDDVPAQMSAQALCSMLERHITLEVIRGGGVASSSIWLLAELWWRAVYSRPEADAAAGSSGAPSA
jgi:AcrR family transcriptional regulator